MSRKSKNVSPPVQADPQDVFTADELKTVLRFLRKRVVISGQVRMETAQEDMNSMILIVKAAQNIEHLAQQELDGMLAQNKAREN